MGLPVRRSRDHRFEDAEGGRFQTELQGEKRRKTPLWRAPHLWAHDGVGVVEGKYFLAKAGRGTGRRDGGQLAVA
jgi:hypothetical protein